MSLRIIPSTLNTRELLSLIREAFALNEPPFSTLSDDLLLLAFTANCNSNPPLVRERLFRDYGVCNFETLEFFGDRVLYDIVSIILYDALGLASTPDFLTKAFSFLLSNRSLTDLMLNKKACSLVRNPPYYILDKRSFHNLCGDSFEALIGALFIHLIDLELDHSIYITQWLLKKTAFSYFLREYFDINRIPALIYSPVPKEEIKNKDYALETLLTDMKRPLFEIYQELGWPYFLEEREGEFLLYGYPRGERKVIAHGRSREETTERGKDYLYNEGYVFPLTETKRVFSTI